MKQKLLESALVRFARYVIDWRKTRAVIRELNMLSDRQLKDIGITRGEITSLIYRLDKEEKEREE